MRTIWAIELKLHEITLEPNGESEGERIVRKEQILGHYDGSRSKESAELAYKAADEAFRMTK